MKYLELIRASVALLAAFVFDMWLSPLTGLPLDKQQFVELLVWIIGAAIGGWNTKAYHVRRQFEQF